MLALLALAVAAVLIIAARPIASVPVFAAKCPTDVMVDMDRSGRAHMNGKRASVRAIAANTWTIRRGGATVRISRNAAEGPVTAILVGPDGTNGVCEAL